MLKHYFKIAFRNFWKQKSLALINVSGLSIGLACFILFLLYAVNEFTFDRFHANSENIFRDYRWSRGNKDEPPSGSPYMPVPLGPAMKAELPDVQLQIILTMVSRDFLKLILIAVVIAIPLAWLVMQQWLNDFAYRINIQWWVFGVAGIIALVIAIITISLQALRGGDFKSGEVVEDRVILKLQFISHEKNNSHGSHFSSPQYSE